MAGELDPRIVRRADAGYRPPLARGVVPFDLGAVQGFSLHDEGTTNVARKYVSEPFYGPLAVQRWHMDGEARRRDGTYSKRKWSDIAYSFAVERSGVVSEARGLHLRPFAEGTVQRNGAYEWNWPEFCTPGESGNGHFVSILLVHVGIATGNVRPYQFEDETVAARKGRYVAPSRSQLAALDWLLPSLREAAGRPDWGVWGHGGHRIKDCPGPHVWPEIQRGRWDPPKPKPKPRARPKPKSAPESPKTVSAPAGPGFAAELQAAMAAGITDGTRPDDNVTRAEAAVMALRGGEAAVGD